MTHDEALAYWLKNYESKPSVDRAITRYFEFQAKDWMTDYLRSRIAISSRDAWEIKREYKMEMAADIANAVLWHDKRAWN